MVFPCWSVMVMIVLLNDDLMCAVPYATFLRSRRLGRRPPAAGFAIPLARSLFYFRAFLRPATVFFGPLRVRALVRVRWPCTGRLRRCRRPS